MVVYAKSRPVETLLEHTQRLLDGLQEVRRLYGDAILERVPDSYRSVFWNALELVVKCHDLGKIHTPFQNMIRKKLKLPLLPDQDVPELPHNLLSPAFIKPLVVAFPDEIQRAIYQTIAFHHFHGVEFDYVQYTGQWKEVAEVVENDLAKVWHDRLADVTSILSLDSLRPPTPAYKRYLEPDIASKDGDLYRFYVILKGLLHRLDHSASAHLPVEEDFIAEATNCVTSYLLSKRGVALESIWQRDLVSSLSDKNVLLTASTGIGKTEFALYWLNGQKGFYTLPVRTSVNAMYDRLIETFEVQDRVGLLHSDGYFYCLEDYLLQGTSLASENAEGAQQIIRYVDLARQFAMPVTVSTADQLFPAVFKYKGYEKIYATLAYSKVIVDEIQSYNPDLAAVILRGLVEIAQLGGQFCLVTATLPPIYREYLEKHVQNLEILPPRYLPARKHKVRLELAAIDDEHTLQHIAQLHRDYKKVLIIVNTVKKAQALYRKLTDFWKRIGSDLPVSLLHSGFIYQDRREKERDILDKHISGIWITTQLVEVSLNIDFPVLITEVATIDALIQRMGRVLRFTEHNFIYDGPPNVFVCLNASGIGSIYDGEVVQKTVDVLRDKEGCLLSEIDKAGFIEGIFTRSALQGTSYYRKFCNSLQMLETGYEADTRSEAQRLFRSITNLNVIPCEVYHQYTRNIGEALAMLENKEASRKEASRLEKFRALATLKGVSVSVPIYKVRKATLSPLKKHDLFLITMRYTKELGLEPAREIENIF
jgi:CRISPR-associated endonuclease/helicase Cas3